MKTSRLIASLALLLACLQPASAQTDLPAGGQLIFQPAADGAHDPPMQLMGSQVQLGQLSTPTLNNGDHADRAAYRVAVRQKADLRWNLQLAGDISAPLREGHVYLLQFAARCLESTTGDGSITVKLERNAPDWRSVLQRAVTFGPEWTRFDLPLHIESKQGFGPGESRLTFQLGETVQTLEIADVRLLDFADRVELNDLPRTRQTYPGMEADADWRDEAARRIDRLRKADLAVTVVDADGRPVPDARVRVQQTRHAFVFGTAMNVRFASSGKPEVPRYLDELTRRFNGVVFENALKWWGPELRDAEHIEQQLAFVESHGMQFRGHTLVWPGSRHLPDYITQQMAHLQQHPDDDEARTQLLRAVDQRIVETTRRFAGRVDDWDVVNEPYTNHDLLDALDPPSTPPGAGVMAHWYELAREHDPAARLFLNDYGILTAGDHWSSHQQHFYDTARQLLDAGAPLDGLGMQGHFGSPLTGPTRVWQILDRFAELGLPIKVTEYDINADDPRLMADYTRDFYTAAFAHPSVEAIYAWGFWSEAHWRPQAAFLDKDFSSRPHDEALRRLLLDQWWTDQTLPTDDAGRAQLRGFRGDYRLTVESPHHPSQTLDITLDQAGTEIRVPLPRQP